MSTHYYAGGLAELVPSPSPLTFSFLVDWFTGKGSLGKAMSYLTLPYEAADLPILALKDNELVVDLTNEERTLYQKTIFTYKLQHDLHKTPKLVVSASKSIKPANIINTTQMLLLQSRWIANPGKVIAIAKKLAAAIPEQANGSTIQETDEELGNKVWPNVIAIGFLSEFINQLVMKEAKEDLTNVNTYISRNIAKDDWFFLSVADQYKVKQNELSFSDYITTYGLRADKDYELTCPRWYEMQDVIKKRIEKDVIKNDTVENTSQINEKIQPLANASITLQLLRCEAKKKTLVHIDHLRKVILEITNTRSDISHMTKADILSGKRSEKVTHAISQQTKKVQPVLSGKGVIVSPGFVVGAAKHISDNNVSIPKGTIGIFPNASPELAIQYPKCDGMIFLKGGQTSHGAIVAREFGIPAIIDDKAAGIPDSANLALNAAAGEWNIRE
jgi:phosphohistidine swiveling domain-containing protein